MPSESEKSRMDRWVHWTLLAGVLLSGLLLAVGLGINLIAGVSEEPGPPLPVRRLSAAALGGDGTALIDLGLLALIGTPVLRVAVLAFGWLIDREFRMAAVAIAVLILLGLGITLGLG